MNTSISTAQVNDLPLGSDVRVLASNVHGLIALDKPAGIMTHPNQNGAFDRCLLSARYDYKKEYYAWKVGDAEHKAWLLNRLDSPTSGIVLLALNEAMSATVKSLFAAHKVQKVYYAVVRRTPFPLVGCWKDPLKKVAYRGSRASETAQTVVAQTRYEVVEKSVGLFPISLLKLMPVTGRTHQLRIQCQQHDYPIVGDRTYGDFRFNRKIAAATGNKRLMLHSAETRLKYTLSDKEYLFQAKSALPPVFSDIVSSNTHSL